jgi:hypothetical protein
VIDHVTWNNLSHYFDPDTHCALPTWPYSSGWGYYPSGGIGLILVIVLILLLLGRI